jgi:hypothetical protein
MAKDGHWMWSPTGRAADKSSHVHPERRTSVEVPDTSPPSGAAMTCVIPFARVTGISSESGLIAIAVCTCGLIEPVSAMSTPPATEPISTRPTTVFASIRPGYRCLPAPSTTEAPGSGASPRPTATIRPPRKLTVPSSITSPETVWTVAWTIETAGLCAARRSVYVSGTGAGIGFAGAFGSSSGRASCSRGSSRSRPREPCRVGALRDVGGAIELAHPSTNVCSATV